MPQCESSGIAECVKRPADNKDGLGAGGDVRPIYDSRPLGKLTTKAQLDESHFQLLEHDPSTVTSNFAGVLFQRAALGLFNRRVLSFNGFQGGRTDSGGLLVSSPKQQSTRSRRHLSHPPRH
jgi:hypothetical protein